jgi:hypothetical protein
VNSVGENGEYDEFIEQMNYIIDHYKELMAARRGHKKTPVTPVTPAK